jgi:hypothetical protein
VHRMGLLPDRVNQPGKQSCTVVRDHHEGHDVAESRGVL